MPTLKTLNPPHYQTLGVEPTATLPEIKKAYRKLAMACHPDKVSLENRDEYSKKFIAIDTAYKILSDEKKRAEYDGEHLLQVPSDNPSWLGKTTKKIAMSPIAHWILTCCFLTSILQDFVRKLILCDSSKSELDSSFFFSILLIDAILRLQTRNQQSLFHQTKYSLGVGLGYAYAFHCLILTANEEILTNETFKRGFGFTISAVTLADYGIRSYTHHQKSLFNPHLVPLLKAAEKMALFSLLLGLAMITVDLRIGEKEKGFSSLLKQFGFIGLIYSGVIRGYNGTLEQYFSRCLFTIQQAYERSPHQAKIETGCGLLAMVEMLTLLGQMFEFISKDHVHSVEYQALHLSVYLGLCALLIGKAGMYEMVHEASHQIKYVQQRFFSKQAAKDGVNTILKKSNSVVSYLFPCKKNKEIMPSTSQSNKPSIIVMDYPS